jgi:hypothetical protein
VHQTTEKYLWAVVLVSVLLLWQIGMKGLFWCMISVHNQLAPLFLGLLW